MGFATLETVLLAGNFSNKIIKIRVKVVKGKTAKIGIQSNNWAKSMPASFQAPHRPKKIRIKVSKILKIRETAITKKLRKGIRPKTISTKSLAIAIIKAER